MKLVTFNVSIYDRSAQKKLIKEAFRKYAQWGPLSEDNKTKAEEQMHEQKKEDKATKAKQEPLDKDKLKEMVNFICKAKADGFEVLWKSLIKFSKSPKDYIEEQKEVWIYYEEMKKQRNAIDFQDMISMVVDHFENNSKARELYQTR